MIKKIFTLVNFFIINFAVADKDIEIGNNFFESSNTNNSIPSNKSTNKNRFLRVGNSYFQKNWHTDAYHPAFRQVGIDYQQQSSGASWVSPFVDYLSSNNFYYELRAYFIYNYIYQNPSVPNVPINSQNNVIGGGVRGLFGYLIPITSRVTLLPLISLWYMNNAFYTYSDTLGNSISSNSYIATLGIKLELEISDIVALYFIYTGGYQFSSLGGNGIYANANNPNVSGIFSNIEIGLPYNASKSWSIVPYTQLLTSSARPNSTASNSIWNINQLTTTNYIYGLRVIYTW